MGNDRNDKDKSAVKIKICGLYRMEDVEYVNEAKPDYVGFIIDFPKSHRNVSIQQVSQLTGKLKSEIQSVGVFVNQDMEAVAEAAQYLDVMQLHGDESNAYIEQLRLRLPEKEIWKAFKIRNIRDLEQAADSIADKVVLDNGYGTGEVFDWSLLEHLAHVDRPFILAGGLELENLEEAIERFYPFALDISSGVEVNRCKDREKIKEVVERVRQLGSVEVENR